MPAALLIIAALVATWPSVAMAAICQSSPGKDGRHWVYRTIDGRRCWVHGTPGVSISKSTLRWVPKSESPAEKTQYQTSSEQDEIDALLHSYWPPLPRRTDGVNN
jgi:hypothetical protein